MRTSDIWTAFSVGRIAPFLAAVFYCIFSSSPAKALPVARIPLALSVEKVEGGSLVSLDEASTKVVNALAKSLDARAVAADASNVAATVTYLNSMWLTVRGACAVAFRCKAGCAVTFRLTGKLPCGTRGVLLYGVEGTERSETHIRRQLDAFFLESGNSPSDEGKEFFLLSSDLEIRDQSPLDGNLEVGSILLNILLVSVYGY